MNLVLKKVVVGLSENKSVIKLLTKTTLKHKKKNITLVTGECSECIFTLINTKYNSITLRSRGRYCLRDTLRQKLPNANNSIGLEKTDSLTEMFVIVISDDDDRDFWFDQPKW